MPSKLRQFPRQALVLVLLLGLRAWAADSFDLTREKPVPANEPIPVADFFRYPLVTAPAINLDGTQIAALYSKGRDWTGLMVYDIDKAKFNVMYAPGERNITSFRWLDAGHFICTYSNTPAVVAVDSRRLDLAHPIIQLSAAFPVGVPVKNRLKPLIWVRSDFYYQGEDDGVVQVDTRLERGQITGPFNQISSTQLDQVRDDNAYHIVKNYPAPGGDLVTSYLSDKDGGLAFATTIKNGVQTLHRFTDGHWESCPIDLDQIDVIGCGDEPGQLVVLGPRGTGKPRPLEFMDAATGKPGEVLLEIKGHDFSGSLFRERADHMIVGAEYTSVGPQNAWFAKSYAELQTMLSKDPHLRGMAVRILGSGVPQRRFLVQAFSDRQPSEYYLLDLQTRSLRQIMSSRPWIDPRRMLPMSIFQYRTHDGHEFDAYATLPRGVSKQHPAPLVVLVHDDMNARDSWGYNGEAQFLASRGYAVLQPNYRGNEGYGWEFTRAQEWDLRGMSNDITAATKALLTSGYVDPKRVAIMGSGMIGGYLALSGAVFDPDLYRCCVVNDGIFDMADLIDNQKFVKYNSPFYSSALRFLGNPGQDPEKFKAISPLDHVDQIKAATFVDYLRSDVLNTTESHRLLDRLEKQGVPHEDLPVGDTFAGRNHLEDQVDIYSHIQAFLAKYLAGGN